MKSPYEILGVPDTATDDEVKKAYRALAKKYHPDANPGDKVAEQKMKEINAAYDRIMNKQADAGYGGESSYGGYGGYGGFGGFGGYSGYGGYSSQSGSRARQEEAPRMKAVYNFLSYGRYQEALNALSGIPESERGARYYYYSALAHRGLGNRMLAMEHAERAVKMEPDNEEYLDLAAALKNPGSAYSTFGKGYTVSAPNVGGICLSVCLMQLLCRFCYC